MTTEPQAASAVFMVRPDSFASNPETLASNRFQKAGLASAAIRAAASREFEGLARALVDAGVDVHVFGGRPPPASPDEVFPNNWLSTHADGTIVLYPLMAPSRRSERRLDIVAALDELYRTTRIVDLSAAERRGAFLEGTGSLVLDRPGRVAYASMSPRTSPAAVRQFETELGYTVHAFTALDSAGRPVYHTNVLMSVGTAFAVVCGPAVPDAAPRRRLFAHLEASGRELVEIDLDQMGDFAGNLLELATASGPLIALSTRALAALRPAQRRALERHAALLPADVATIETYGGGGVRCMLTEIHLQRAEG